MIKKANPWGDTLNVCTKKKDCKYVKQNSNLKIYKSTIIVGNFNTPFSTITVTKRKISKVMKESTPPSANKT